MAGRKARCQCGTVVRLGPKISPSPTPEHGRVDRKPGPGNQTTDSVPAKLVGDELLGDRLLDGDLSGGQSAQQDSSTPDVVDVPVIVLPPLGLAHPKPAKIKNQKTRPKTHETRSAGKTKKSDVVLEDAYGDLDKILGGQGDAAPLMIRSPVEAPADSDQPTRGPGDRQKQRPSSFGFLAALGSATTACWFGVLVVIARFQIVDLPLLSEFAETLQSVFQAVFGMAEVTRPFQLLFMGLGWALWGVGIALVIFGLAQFANAFFRILFGRSLMGWSDGLVAAMGVCGLFLMVAMVFTHASFTKQQNRLLDQYDQPSVLDRGPIGNVELLRDEVNNQGASFRTTMLVGSAVPMSIFLLSMVRLFLRTPDMDRDPRNNAEAR